ncbi:MAG: hypothetical protein ACRC6V_02045 [Bacteroidales bacterium]
MVELLATKTNEEVAKAINHWLTVVCRQEYIIVEKVEPEFEKQYYPVNQFADQEFSDKLKALYKDDFLSYCEDYK